MSYPMKTAGGIALSPMVEGAEEPIIQALLCATDHGILMTDHAGRDVLCNPRFGELFDVDPDVVVQSTREEVRAMALARVKDPDAFVALLEMLYADPSMEHEDEIELATENPRILRRYTAPVFNERGNNIGRVWTFQDVTKTRQLEAEVRAHADRTTADLTETAMTLDAMTSISEGVTSSANAHALAGAIARATAKLAGNESSALLYPETDGFRGVAVRPNGALDPVTIPRAEIESILTSGKVAEVQTPSPSLEAVAGRANVTLLGLDASEGHNHGILVLGADAERRPYDEPRKTHLRAVADQAALALESFRLRTELQSAYDELRLAQDGLVESAKLSAVGMLAAGIAHDIRNILTPLQLELSEMKADSGLEGVHAQIGRLFALTYRLLSLSRPAKVNRQRTGVSETLDSVLHLITPQADVDRIRIDLDIPRGLPDVLADSVGLEHVFINLGLNALSVMAPTGGTMTVTALSYENEVEIVFEDSGPGISAENLDRIFTPFFTTRSNGTGLGLYSARRILEEMGGAITAGNAPGGGAIFRVRLPNFQEDLD